MNKLLFNYKRESKETIRLIANNEKDLMDYLYKTEEKYNWIIIELDNNQVIIDEGSGVSIIPLVWVKHI